MYAALGSRQSSRFQPRTVPDMTTSNSTNIFQDIEDNLTTNTNAAVMLGDEYISDISSMESSAPAATTYIYVDGDGAVKQKIVRPTSRIFGRFQSPQSQPRLQQRPEQLGRADIINDIIETAVASRVAEIMKRGEILPAMADNKIMSNRQYIPFFNDELFATNDCKTEISDTNIKIVVELAGILTDEPRLYPFGYQPISSIPLHYDYTLQPQMEFQWKSEDGSEGIAIGEMSSQKDPAGNSVYSISFSSWILKSQCEVSSSPDNPSRPINFDEIELPVTLTFSETF